ncbi:MAG TPA: DUF1501 domain-containing protein [Bryobacteraceae bacterium]|nr:DUF1501 domain-containing protein [Bryobacteraceae bacterium]
MTRRDFLTQSYLGLGGLALGHLMAAETVNPMLPKLQHLPAKAKRCIFLFLEGGVSQVDLFEYRPALQKFAGQQIPKPQGTVGEIATFSAAPNRLIPAPYKFSRHGQSGRWITELLPNLAEHVDDLAFVHGVKVDNNNHGPAVYHTLTGNMFPGSASVGAWVTYGLGSENQDLPGFIVLGDHRGAPIGGAGVWGNGFLPAAYQGTIFRPGDTPIVDLKPRPDMTPQRQRAELDLLRWFDQKHAAQRSDAGELEARIAAYELAFRMQIKAPELVNIQSESEATRKLYGLDDPVSEPFGRQCLLARRMVERGVRFVLALHGAGGDRWDDHGDIKGRLPKHCKEVDKPVAGLLQDLKARGLLEDTLVVWASEMGRTPFDNNLVTDKPGRDHNQYGLVVWMAGGDVKPGATFGQTDDFGLKSVDQPIPLRDVHATILRLLGLDQNRLTYLSAGRFKKLTDIGGRVITEMVA